MSDVTRILAQIDSGDPQAAEQLLPLVYDELRKLAAARLAHEKPGQTLEATALVHEAYLRLVGSGNERESGREGDRENDQPPPLSPSPPLPLSRASFHSRGHFFAAAAEAMRRILVESARRKSRDKHGGQMSRCDAELDVVAAPGTDPVMVLAVHEALDRLAQRSPRKAELVKLRYFLGCTLPEAAEILGIAAATAEEDWTFARTWLRREWLRGEASQTKKDN
jgi:DNA-directed RNA polymerase specialized sigma24 family protein